VSSGSLSNRESELRLRAPRSLPPWIDSYEQRYGNVAGDQLRLLSPPPRTVQAHHNSTPSDPERRVSKDGFVEWEDPLAGQGRTPPAKVPHMLRYGRAPRRGRKWDHLRSAEPVIIPGYIPRPAMAETSTTWHDFAHSSAWGRGGGENSQVIGYDELQKLQPTFGRPVDVMPNPLDQQASRGRRTLALSKRLWNAAMRHSLSPLLFRMTVLITSVCALGIAAEIFHLEDAVDQASAERTQAIVAMVVDSVAVPYILYMLWDEYTGKPLGLRSAVSKISLILLDLFFIIFKSASTALAFESLIYHNVRGPDVRALAKALAAFMLVGLIAWIINLTVNIFRTVERLGGGDDDGERA
jgi:hypothetical protein